MKGDPDSEDGTGIRPREFAWLRTLVHREVGINLTDAKRAMLVARLSRRLRHLGLASFVEYVEHLRTADPEGAERRALINCLTTNKTDFLREAHHFTFLRERLFPELRQRAAQGGPRRMRIWSAGCSTGEEPYSVAMTIRDHFGSPAGWDIGVVASDVDTEVLAEAAQGIYPEDRLGPVPEALRGRHFERGRSEAAGLWRVCPELRALVEFRQINLNGESWPLQGPFEAIFCRNVVIYFDRSTQRRIFERMADHLAPDGYLFVGHSETLGDVADRFDQLGKTVHRRAKPVSGPALEREEMAPAVRRASDRRIVVGEVFVSREPMTIGTILGSCVSACLFDPEARVGGMNHFLLPSDGRDGTRNARYGDHAMPMLISEIVRLGGERGRLVAKVFGGAARFRSGTAGQENVRFVRQFLAAERIPIVAERVGGTRGIEVSFHTTTGDAWVRRLKRFAAAVDEDPEDARPKVVEPA